MPATDPPPPPAATPAPTVLVLGTAFANAAKRQAARQIGQLLADSGFALVCGDSSGIDRWVAESFCAACTQQGRPLAGAFTQLALGALRFFSRGGTPWGGFGAPGACRVPVPDTEAWKREALARCQAAVMVGGGRGALDIAMRLIAQGKPVFPIPFLGGLTGSSDAVFRQILRTWEGHPVPGVSRNQFLRLAEPWVVGTGPLRHLLRGTLATAPDIFVSYRRSDAPAAAGRVAAALGEHFGPRRVFLDVHGIAPSRDWDATLDAALAASRVGVVIIGRQWLAPGRGGTLPRLHDAHDVVRAEVAALLGPGKAVFPVLVEGAALPDAAELPEPLAALLRHQAVSIGQADWDATMAWLIREIEGLIEDRPGREARWAA